MVPNEAISLEKVIKYISVMFYYYYFIWHVELNAIQKIKIIMFYKSQSKNHLC